MHYVIISDCEEVEILTGRLEHLLRLSKPAIAPSVNIRKEKEKEQWGALEWLETLRL